MQKGDTVFYSTGSADVRARVERMHRDDSVTVTALFYVSSDGEDVPGYLGFKYRMGRLRSIRTGATMNRIDIRSTVKCDGLRARVKREVFAAAIAPAGPDRNASLAYWHARQRNMDRVYYANRLFENRHPTKEERAFAREMAKVGNWYDSAEARAERRQLGTAD